jgi:hypothetical protein
MGNLYVNSEGKQTFYSRDNADISCRLEWSFSTINHESLKRIKKATFLLLQSFN